MKGKFVIVVIRPNRLGDMICTLPLLAALRRQYPHAEIRVLSGESGELIAKQSGSVNRVAVLRKGLSRWDRPLWNREVFQKSDLVIVAKGGYDRSLAWMAKCSGASRRIGFDADKVNSFYTDPIELPPYEHQIDSLFRLLLPLGIKNPEVAYDLRLPEESIAQAFELIKQWNEPYVILNPWCNRGIYWPLDRLAALANRLVAVGHGVWILEAIGQSVAQEIVGMAQHEKVRLLTAPDVMTLAVLLKQAKLFWTPEGGLAHLSAAVGGNAFVVWRKDGVIQKWRSRGGRVLDFIPSDGLEGVSVESMMDALTKG